MATELTGHQLINGNWQAAIGPTFTGINPATGAELPTQFTTATVDDVDAAFAAAKDAAATVPDGDGLVFAKLLDAIADEIMDLGDPLLERASAESGLPVTPRLVGERGRTCGQLRMFAEHVRCGNWVDAVIDTADPNREPAPKPDIRRANRPVGPVVVFDASNFPLAFGACGGDTASALAAGNPVIVKSHPSHPGTNEMCAGAVQRALAKVGLPAGMFTLLQGIGYEIGVALVEHPDAAAVGFTGSQAGGRALFDVAVARPNPIPFFAEMGSVNPLVLLPGAISERGEQIAQGLAQSITLGAGQFCTKPGLIFVVDNEASNSFLSTLADQLSAAPEFVMLNSSIQENFARCVELIGGTDCVSTKVKGAASNHAGATAGLFTVSSSDWLEDMDLHQEVFGPAAMVVRCEDVDDLCTTIDALEGNLTGTLHTGDSEDGDTVSQVAHALEQRVGRLIYNGFPTGVEVCHAMIHGGPYPATTAAATTSVGSSAIQRFARPVAFQNCPDNMLPKALQNANPLGLTRLVDGELTTATIS